MLFNSLDFAIFLPIVYILYWFGTSRNLKLQNLLIVLSSYIFYGWWDWRFLSLILFSTLVDYLVGLRLETENNSKKRLIWLWTSILVNLGFLGFFKYYNFFIENFMTAFSIFGIPLKANSLNIILPVGISFYTFQTLSYTIDVYKKKLAPTKDFIAFAAFVSFFPQLVAGPIERATHLLPQFFKKRTFDYENSVMGLRQILWGFFKKLVIADNCAELANLIFENYSTFSGLTLLLGALFFAFQIYGDFSGYSDIAIGTSKLFGFSLMQNFAFPYFSRDIAEFWRRWHISLSTWFRDYLYIPLGGSRGSALKKLRNTLIIFTVSGFWHGANWTFIFWGFLNAVYFIPLLITEKNRSNLDIIAMGKILPGIKEFLQMTLTFFMTLIAWIFFRSESMGKAFHYIGKIFSPSILQLPSASEFMTIKMNPFYTVFLILSFLVIEWLGREGTFAIEGMKNRFPQYFRWLIYLSLGLIIFIFGNFTKTEFIYFAF
ncbi:MAG: MBOAT family protein [Candidatus Marinimicrobia bacterium]|nr:MBOAT family protein [Candidatus Neomarinimicrobiota bacterium]